jgi:hypothetical protein
MPKAIRFGNTNGHVVRTSIGEATRRSRNLAEGEEVWVEPAHRKGKPLRRSSRELDPDHLDQAFMLAFVTLHDAGVFTPDEIAYVLNISRATFYRKRDALLALRKRAK